MKVKSKRYEICLPLQQKTFNTRMHKTNQSSTLPGISISK